MMNETVAMNNMPANNENQRVMDEALNWFVILQSGHYTKEQENEFKAWLNATDTAKKAYADIAQNWEHSGFTDELLAASLPVNTEKRPIFFKLNWVPLASFAVIAICVLSLLFQADPDIPQVTPASKHFASTYNDNEQVELDDGSSILLSGSSSFSMVGELDSRHVKFERGAANFSIQSDPSKPFIVDLDNLEVVVTGTTFEIRKSREEIRISLFEGSVRLRNAQSLSSEEGKMKPGERVTIHLSDNSVSRSLFDIASQPSWIHKRLDYKNAPLSEVVQDINRYRKIPVRLSGSEIGDVKVTASVKTDQTDSFIAGLATTHKAKIIDAGSSIVLSL
jgi:transmembrane sensor